MVRALALSVVLLLNPNFITTAQDLPPLPEPGFGTKLTPEEWARLLAEAEVRAKERAAYERYLKEITILPLEAFSTNKTDEVRLLSVESLLDERKARARANAVESLRKSQESMEAARQHLRQIGRSSLVESMVDSGQVVVGMEGGGLKIWQLENWVAARTIQTDKLWPGGGLGLNLSGGDGLTNIALFEGAIPAMAHEAFGGINSGRITDLEFGTSQGLNFSHATRVAGTIMSAGVILSSRGMAYEAKINAYDLEGAYSEMSNAYDAFKTRLSNHSYGAPSGWFLNNFDGLPYWGGRTNLSTVEDYHFGYYDQDEARAIDAICYDAPYALPVYAAGNERGPTGQGPTNQPAPHFVYNSFGIKTWVTNLVHPADGDTNGYDTLNTMAVAKNILTVGSMRDLQNGYAGPSSVTNSWFSSRGPTDSGRIKPDLVASGEDVFSPDYLHGSPINIYTSDSGTSYAAPSVTGLLNLLLQLYRELHPGKPDPLASTMKALIIGTADEAGPFDGPDFIHGWGLPNGGKAAQLIQSNALNTAKPHLNELMLQQGKKIRFPIQVSSTNQLVKATIVWTDPEGPIMSVALDSPLTDLINNLDLKIIGPNGVTNFAWVLNADTAGESVALRSAAATKGTNNVDNVEQVCFWPTTTGLYTVEISHQGTLQDGYQMVSLAVTGNNALAIPPLRFVNSYLQNGTYPTFLFTGVPGLTYRIEYLTNVTGTVWLTNSTLVATQTTNAFSVNSYGTERRFYRAVLVY